MIKVKGKHSDIPIAISEGHNISCTYIWKHAIASQGSAHGLARKKGIEDYLWPASRDQ